MAGWLHSNALTKEAAMMMRKRRLGTTELEITTVGLGSGLLAPAESEAA